MAETDDPLALLRDIHLPSDPALWPPAPGWWGLGILAVAVLWWGYKTWFNYKKCIQPSRALIEQLERILPSDNPKDNHQSLIKISALARQYAITRFGRDRIAGLTGTNWIEFVNQSVGKPLVPDSLGQMLSHGPYQKPANHDINLLKQVLIQWARQTAGSTTETSEKSGYSRAGN